MNKITLIGNLVADPEQRETSTGKKVTTFRMAVDRRFTGQNAEKATDFFRINVWGKNGDACKQYLAKGRQVAVVGELHADTYTDKEGMTRLSLDVSAEEVEFLRNSAPTTEDKPKKTYKESDFTDIQTEDIPF